MNTQGLIQPDNSIETTESERLLLFRLHDVVYQPPIEWPKHYSHTLSALIAALKAKDSQLYRHSYRVQYFARQLTAVLKLTEEETKTIKLAALLHDIGKIGIHETILGKTSCLTQQEFEIVKEHPARGAFLLNSVSCLKKVVPIVLCHHERWDGGGYPHGLSKKAIPLGARIVAIADAFEVMTSQQRAYQTQRSFPEAIQELRRCSGIQFDRTLVNVFCASFTSDLALVS